MESKLPYHLTTLSTSTAKIMAWLPRLRLLSPLGDSQDPVATETLATPGSLRDAHNAACAWFLGPRAENADYFKMYVDTILNDVTQGRRNFAPEDEVSFCLSLVTGPSHDSDSSGLCRCKDCLFARV